jgi:glycosyltransferase involved in cell wall biosynthesis
VVIAGNNDEDFVKELRRVAAECAVGDRVQFLPRQITGADKEALFAAARVFALPSLSENFGNVVTEAMIRHVPVVVTEGVGVADIVRGSGAGIVAGSGHKDLAAALADLLGSEQRLAQAGAAGAAYARDRLTWDKVSRSFEELYRTIARSGTASPRQAFVDAA